MPSGPARLVIASRESKLALWQAHYVRARVSELYPCCEQSILGLTTTGDRVLDVSLAKIGGKGLFVKELELALQEGSADIAVHSMKDVPMELPPGFELLVVGQREDARDAFVSNNYARLEDLPAGSVVGTSSLRRESQIRHRFPRLRIEPLRGNVETRLRKLDRGDYAAIVLAAAGLKRLERADRIRAFLEIEESLPAVGQGALGIEFLTERTDLQAALAPLTSNSTSACVHAERALSRRLAGSCNVPLAAHATLADDRLRLRAMVASPDGRQLVRAELDGSASEAVALGTALAEKLIALGAGAILARIAAGQS